MSQDHQVLTAPEWEPLNEALETRVVGDPMAAGASVALRIVRDETLVLRGVVHGAYSAILPERQTGLRHGELIPRADPIVVREQSGGARITLEGALVLEHRRSFGGEEPEASVRIGRLVIDKRKPMDAGHMTCSVWCVNGPNSSDFMLPRETFRVTRPRTVRVAESDPRWTEAGTKHGARDWMVVPHPWKADSTARLGKVPQGEAPDGLGACAIEFGHLESASPPDVAALDSYLSALSFVLGRRLAPLGVTLSDVDGQPVFHALQSVWALDLRRECDLPAEPPVSLQPRPTLTRSEEVVAELVPAYLRCAEELNLDDALRFHWLAGCVPLEAALPPLASALECVVNAWFKSSKTKSGGKYLEDRAWTEVSSGAMAMLEAALAGRPLADRVMRRARSANVFGVNERVERFFEEIGLRIGDVETRAMKAHNRPSHGDALGDVAPQGLLSTVQAYRTLFNRVVLALLGWKGNYVDYSTLGVPSRSLSEPLGGPEGNGVAAAL